ncbi:MAG: hypothetical protein PHR18_01275 [Oscillospiraceae bacterium]|nr:hypothetical protein [Oscillospiraceae bacterium]MDD3832516.1 hypothetical protein [Oscillospiraceae bacterium]
MSRRFPFVIILILLVVLMIAGCDKDKPDSSADQTTTPATVPTLLDVKIGNLVTPEQVSNALGIKVGEGIVVDQDTAVRYYSEDGGSYCDISMLKCSREIYDSAVAAYTDAEDTLNLGQVAKWSADTKQIVIYNGNYMISVSAVVKGKSNEHLLSSARQIAALALEKLG